MLKDMWMTFGVIVILPNIGKQRCFTTTIPFTGTLKFNDDGTMEVEKKDK